MKKILLVNKSFELGGIQSSMVNMANELSQFYEVHLFIYNPAGVMQERLKQNVKLLDSSWMFHSLGMSLKQAIQTKNAKIIAFRLFAGIWSRLINNELPISIAVKNQPKMTGYDLAIAYHQEQRKKSAVSGFTRVVDRCVDAKKKVAWLHFDSKTIDLDSQYNNKFYQRMDKIICVSRSLKENFAEDFPTLSDKMDYCYNFMLYDTIREKSLDEQTIAYPQDKFVCFSACRLSEEKALVRGISAFSNVLKEHSEVVWYIAGDGIERNNIENAIKEHSLEQQIILIGNQPNPYPYIRNANLVINVSYHEAAPMIFLESKALGTPVFATRTSSADELLRDRIDSFICENTEKEIRNLFQWIVEHKECVNDAKLQLTNYYASNDSALLKIKEILE